MAVRSERTPGAVRSRRPLWWEVPPHGYLEVESRNSPTSPRALRRLARETVKAGLTWNPGNPLPVQRFVQAQERARLVFQARRELPRLTAVASQIMLIDSRLAQAEEALRRAVDHRTAGVAVAERPGTAAGPPTGRPSEAGADPELPARPVLGPWSEVAVLAAIAAGQAVLAYTAASAAGLGPLAPGLLAPAAAVGAIVAAQLAARGLHQLVATAAGAPDPQRRRQLDVGVAAGALACGVLLTAAIGRLGDGTGPAAMGLALLGLATAACYAATPHGAGGAGRWRSLAGWLARQRAHRRDRRHLQAARAGEAAAEAAVRELREELAVLVPQLFAAEQSALLFWRYQVAIGDASQHAFEQRLAADSMRRARGFWRPISEWWRGTPAAPTEVGAGLESVGGDSTDWGDQVARVTMAAKRVLVRRGLLDITHGLRLPSLPGAPALDHNGNPSGSHPDGAAGDGHHQPVVRSTADPG